MCYRAGQFMGPEAAADRTTLRQLGWLGEDAPRPIGLIDPTPDSPGVEVYQHPAVLVARDPELHRVVRAWDTGVRRKPRAGDSAWWTAALMTMRGAEAREREREMKRAREAST